MDKYKITVIAPPNDIDKEVFAEHMYISEGAYTFINKDRKAVAYYPVQHTVIWNIEYNVNDVSLEKTSGEGNRKIAGIVTDLNSTGEM